MLSKSYRLPAKLISQFSGTKIRGQFTMVISRSSSGPHDRLAVVISKKVYPKAHDRNHLKRLIHESLRPWVDRPPSFDHLIVVFPHPPTPDVILAELTSLITKLKS